MAPHLHWRAFVGKTAAPGVAGRVVPAVHRAGLAEPVERLSHRDSQRRCRRWRLLLTGDRLTGGPIQTNQLSGAVGIAEASQGNRAGARHLDGDRLSGHLRQLPGAAIVVKAEHPQPVEAIDTPGASHPMGINDAVRHRLQDPQRPAEVGERRAERDTAAAVPAPEVPKAVGIAEIEQRTVRGPGRIQRRYSRGRGDSGGPVRISQIGDHNVRPIPRHVGQIPLTPSKPSLGGETRMGVEVSAVGHDPAAVCVIRTQPERDNHLGCWALAAMILPNRQQHVVLGVQRQARVAQAIPGGQRTRGPIRSEQEERAVRPTGVDHHSIGHGPGTTTVFVHTGADIQLRGEVGRRAGGVAAPQADASGLVGVALGPILDLAVDDTGGELDRTTGEITGTDRRRPRAVGQSRHQIKASNAATNASCSVRLNSTKRTRSMPVRGWDATASTAMRAAAGGSQP